MKTTRITVVQKGLPLERALSQSAGRPKFETLGAAFAKVEGHADVAGWDKGVPWGHKHFPDDGPGIRASTETMAVFVLGLDLRRHEDVDRATGWSVFTDTEALHLAATVPDPNCYADWTCPNVITVDIAGGPGNREGHLHVPQEPGLGVCPGKNTSGGAVALYQ